MLSVARHDLIDLRRQRGIWTGLLLIPFVTVSFLLLLPGVLAQRERSSNADAVHRVALQTPELAGAGGAGTAEAAAALGLGRRFRVSPSEDARRDVLDGRADVGVLLEVDVVRALAADEAVEGDIFLLSSRSRSRAALGAVASAISAEGLEVGEERLEVRGLPAATARPVAIELVDLSSTPRGRRLSLARLLPLLVLLPAAGAVGVASQRISGSKDQRVFEPLLVLPFTRAELALGKALSAFTIGTINLVAIAVPLLLGRQIPLGGAGRQVYLSLGDIAAATVIGAVLLVLLVCLGVAVGAASRTSAELSSVLQTVTLPIFLMGSLLQFRSGIPTETHLLVLPFFGLLLCVRDVAIGALSSVDLAVAVSATLGWAALALGVATKILQGERSVVRSIT